MRWYWWLLVWAVAVNYSLKWLVWTLNQDVSPDQEMTTRPPDTRSRLRKFLDKWLWP